MILDDIFMLMSGQNAISSIDLELGSIQQISKTKKTTPTCNISEAQLITPPKRRDIAV